LSSAVCVHSSSRLEISKHEVFMPDLPRHVRVVAISDTHLPSIYCDESALIDRINS
jgi:predicted MPP superfamily phosphohydrolase